MWSALVTGILICGAEIKISRCGAGKLRVIFICLCILAGIVECATVLLIFRAAVNKLFREKQENIATLSSIKDAAVTSRLNEIAKKKREDKARKAHAKQSQGKKTKFATGKGSIDSSENSSEESDDEGGKGKLHIEQDNLRVEDKDDDEEEEEEGGEEGSKTNMNKTNQQKTEEDGESAGAKRQKLLAIVYYLCLLFILICLGLLGYQCVYAITTAEGTASELNGATRRSYLAERMAYFAHELIYSGDATTLIGAKALTIQSSIDGMRCQLARAVQGLLSTHYGMMYGTFWGWQDLPHKQYWANGPVLYWHDGDKCSPFTWDAASFFTSAVTPGSVGRAEAQDQDETYFGKQCLAKLPKKYKDENNVLYTNKRIMEFTKKFYDSDRPCEGFDRVPEQDPVVSQGLHSFILHMADLGLTISQAPLARLTPINREYISLIEHDNDEWSLGLEKSVLIYQSGALTIVDRTTTYVTILYIFILLLVLAQYLFLGRRIEGLMQEHIGMSAIAARFKEWEEEELRKLAKQKDEAAKNRGRMAAETNLMGSSSDASADTSQSDMDDSADQGGDSDSDID